MASTHLLLQAFLLPQLLPLANGQNKLSVRGEDLVLGGEKVYLSGVNQAWVNYSMDFGHGNYRKSRPALMRTLDIIETNGGNSLRIWLHINGASTPNFNQSGYVTGLDPYLIHDVTDLLNEAGKRNILINLVLWNCAVKPGFRLGGLLNDDSKLQSYIDNGLRPMVRAVKNNTALGVWEIVNEPEGCVDVGKKSSERCFDTTSLNFLDFADWTHADIPLQKLLTFIGRQSAAIHEEDNQALVTVGSWTYKTVTDKFGRRNFYSDQCLRFASGLNASALDLYQIHTYSVLDVFTPEDPFKLSAQNYSLDKPLIIGEFSQKKGGGLTSFQQYTWGYYKGYSGTWAWSVKGDDSASDTIETLEEGMKSLRGKHNQSAGGLVNFIIPTNQSPVCYVYNLYIKLYKIFIFLISFIA